MHKNKVAVTVRCKYTQKFHLYLYLDKKAFLYKHSSRLIGSLSCTWRINCYWFHLLTCLTITAVSDVNQKTKTAVNDILFVSKCNRQCVCGFCTTGRVSWHPREIPTEGEELKKCSCCHRGKVTD